MRNGETYSPNSADARCLRAVLDRGSDSRSSAAVRGVDLTSIEADPAPIAPCRSSRPCRTGRRTISPAAPPLQLGPALPGQFRVNTGPATEANCRAFDEPRQARSVRVTLRQG